MAAKFTKRRKAAIAAPFVLAIAVVGWFAFVRDRWPSDKHLVSSCANHVIQLKLGLLFFAESATNFPTETDTRRAFLAMAPISDHSAEWLASFSSACPEAFFKDGSIGFVFVGDGLPTSVAKETKALLLFCPADSHQRSEQHCHAVMGDGWGLCVKSNSEMMDRLRLALQKASDGTVPYSTNAVARMRQELDARQVHETRRRGSKGNGA